MNVEDRIQLNRFQLRDYQKPIYDAIFNEGYKRLAIVLPRRAGKDLLLFNALVRQCLKEKCLAMHILPDYKQAKKCIWDAITTDGTTFLEYIPSRLIESVNVSELKIRFINGSILQCVGGESHNTSIRGSNVKAAVISEFAYFDDASIIDTLSPILAGNGGWLAIASTPKAKNHWWALLNLAKELPNWWVYEKKTSDINHIPLEALEEERRRMSPELFAQEYECSFDRGISGAIFGQALHLIRKNDQITNVAWEPGLLTWVSMDIGVNDRTTLIFFQVVGNGTLIRIIDCYSNRGLGLDHYAKILQEKPYRYGGYFAPHDLRVREWGTGAITRYQHAIELGINFTILPQIKKTDALETALLTFPKFWIDKTKCQSLIDALENYYKEWDETHQRYREKPVHNWASDYCDSLLYLCQALPHCVTGLSSQEFDKIRHEALYGKQLPKVFQFNPRYDR